MMKSKVTFESNFTTRRNFGNRNLGQNIKVFGVSLMYLTCNR